MLSMIREIRPYKKRPSLILNKEVDLAKDIISEFKRRVFEESYARIFKCLDLLSEEEIWYSPNKNCNSIASLILHLHGNMRQWMTTTFAENEDLRKRFEEFQSIERLNKTELKSLLIKLQDDVLYFLDTISEDDLLKKYKVQVFYEKGISIIIHVIEHFSYHTGQIALLTKLICDKDLEFYTFPLE